MKLYNTLTQKVEDFVPQEKGIIKMYVCGITPYDYAHIGHARTAVFFDVVHRFFKFKGYEVKYVRNITDVDDKIINKALKEGKSYKEVADYYAKRFEDDLKALNVLKPWKEPKVSDHISDIDNLINRLISKGYAYELSDGIYFHVPLFKNYGKLSHQNLEELNKHRIEPNPEKRDVKDFALWKKKKYDDVKVKAVFSSQCCGSGRPGWHIECSAMSMRYLGETLDIHGGGKDLIFPHHENEIAQSEAATGKPFANYWIHVHFVNIKGAKMSKSLKNFITIKDALNKYNAAQLRIFLLNTHYRKDVNYDEQSMNEAIAIEERLRNFLKRLRYEMWFINNKGKILEGTEIINSKENKWNEFLDAIENDFHTEKAIKIMLEFVEETNKALESIDKRLVDYSIESYKDWINTIVDIFKNMNYVLGLYNDKIITTLNLSDETLKKIDEREELRKRKEFNKADAIRDELATQGIRLLDTPYRTIVMVDFDEKAN